jgi:GNAT superfamily N-acetyltransferase
MCIADDAQKIARRAVRFEAWADEILIGLVAGYCNDPGRVSAHITNVSVRPGWLQQGIGRRLVEQFVAHVKTENLQRVTLEVDRHNAAAIELYCACGFARGVPAAAFITMLQDLQQEPQRASQTRPRCRVRRQHGTPVRLWL